MKKICHRKHLVSCLFKNTNPKPRSGFDYCIVQTRYWQPNDKTQKSHAFSSMALYPEQDLNLHDRNDH